MERDSKLNVWIRGNNDNPERVIKTLENLGGENTGHTGRDTKCLYYISLCLNNHFIHKCAFDSTEGIIIMKIFKELKDLTL